MDKKKHINDVITTINKKIDLKRRLKEAKSNKDDAMVSLYQKQINNPKNMNDDSWCVVKE